MTRTIMFISHDNAEMKPVTLKTITDLAFSQSTPDDYADYLNDILKRATDCCLQAGYPIKKIQWRMHENGAVSPFENSRHPYYENFMTPMIVEIPDAITKAR